VYDDMIYHQDRTFFHSFAGDVSENLLIPEKTISSSQTGLHDWLQPR